MIPPPVPEGVKVLIGVPTMEFARQAIFYDHLDILDKPVGTMSTRAHGQSPARGRNMIIKEAIKHDCTHIMFFDDDVVFAPNTLTKLLAHDVDIVTGLYFMRNHPHQPLIFDIAHEDGRCGHHFLKDGEKGLVPIVAAGMGAVLIKTAVFKKMDEDPDNKQEWVRLGELERDHWCDDIGFYMRARRAGFKLYADLECPIGHMATVTLWPNRINGEWHTAYDTQGREVINHPQIKTAKEAYEKRLGKPLWSEPWHKKEFNSPQPEELVTK